MAILLKRLKMEDVMFTCTIEHLTKHNFIISSLYKDCIVTLNLMNIPNYISILRPIINFKGSLKNLVQ